MKTKLTKFTAFQLKALFILTIIGFVSYTNCKAQSVVGTWKRTETNCFTIDKSTGKQTPVSSQYKQQFEEHMSSTGYKEILAIKPDHTYVNTISTNDNSKGTAHNNTWSLSGNTLDMNVPMVRNQKTNMTIKSINSNTMILDVIYMGNPN